MEWKDLLSFEKADCMRLEIKKINKRHNFMNWDFSLFNDCAIKMLKKEFIIQTATIICS